MLGEKWSYARIGCSIATKQQEVFADEILRLIKQVPSIFLKAHKITIHALQKSTYYILCLYRIMHKNLYISLSKSI